MWYKEQDTYKQVRRDANFICWYCGVDCLQLAQYGEGRSTVDHVIPRSRGGVDNETNLVCACSNCNQEKADMTLEEYRSFKWRQVSGTYRFVLLLKEALNEVNDSRIEDVIREFEASEEEYKFHAEKEVKSSQDNTE